MNRTEIAKLVRDRALLEGSLLLRSGKRSDTYFDEYQFASDPKLLRAIHGVP